MGSSPAPFLRGDEMMIGEYPCCEGELWLSMPDKTPTFAPEDCPHCGAKVWHVFSRWSPQTYLEKDFLEKYEVNSKTKTIKDKNPPKKYEDMSAVEKLLHDKMEKAYERAAEQFMNNLLYGTPIEHPSRRNLLR